MSKETKIKKWILFAVGVLIALYVLFPFYLVVMNSFKAQTSIVESPVSIAGASFHQFVENLGKVVNNSNFNFWYALLTSVVITVISLVLLAVLGGMAAWVISRNNKKKWATAIYMIFIAHTGYNYARCHIHAFFCSCGGYLSEDGMHFLY